MATTDSTITPSATTAATVAGTLADTSGFYRLQDGQLQFAPNGVHAPGYTLSRDNREALELPHDGWQWFDTSEAAHAHHGLPLPQPTEPESGDSQIQGQSPGPRRKNPGAGPRGAGAARPGPVQNNAS